MEASGGRVSAIFLALSRNCRNSTPTRQSPHRKEKVNTIVPLIPSFAPCPFTGALHLPRLWLKLTLEADGKLATGYPGLGKGYDAMTVNALRVTPEETVAFVKEKRPTYPEFVKGLKEKGANFSKENIEKHNAAISRYNHDDATVHGVLAANGLTAEEAPFKDACTVNFVDDLKELHTALNPPATEEAVPPEAVPVAA